jgi:phospholipid/cholesterol/gamma-HCH transport system permease protein
MSIRNNIREEFRITGEVWEMFIASVHGAFTRPFYFGRLLEQLLQLGAGSLSITIVIGFVTGLVMTLQFGYGLAKFGGTLYVPAIVSLSLVREISPIFTSLLIAGRIGSGMSAEIGAMAVTQQIDAIRALGTSPIRVLVVPRVMATVISLPLLATFSAFMGIFGGLLISMSEFHMPAGFYVNKVLNTITLTDVFGSMGKCVFFGFIISLVACYRGFNTSEGTKGVGTSATWVVVRTSIIILISDFFLSKLIILVFE